MSRQSYDPNSDYDPQNDPRYRQREAPAEDPQGGLGGLLGTILGGMGQPQPEAEPEEDPRYSQASQRRPHAQDPRYRQYEQREEPQEEAQGGLGGILGGVLGGAGQDDSQVESRAMPTRGGGSPLGGILQMLLSNPRLGMALVVALGSVVMYFASTHQEANPVTDKQVRVVGEAENDVALGLQAAPEMIQQYGGEHRDPRLRAEVQRIGLKLVKSNAVGDWAPEFEKYQWNFHLLADDQTINAFALPGGQIFFTYGLFKRLTTEDEVAGVLGHEIGHVIGRHSAKQMATQKILGGLANAGAVLGGSDTQGGGLGQIAQYVAQMKSLSYGRDDETESDLLGVQFMGNAQYNPGGLIRVMEILKEASGGQSPPEFMSSHPDPGNRIEHIKQVIEDVKSGKLEGPKAPVQMR